MAITSPAAQEPHPFTVSARRWRAVRALSTPVDAATSAAIDADVHAATNRGSRTVAEAIAERTHAQK